MPKLTLTEFSYDALTLPFKDQDLALSTAEKLEALFDGIIVTEGHTPVDVKQIIDSTRKLKPDFSSPFVTDTLHCPAKDLLLLALEISCSCLMPGGSFLSAQIFHNKVHAHIGSFDSTRITEHQYLNKTFFIVDGSLNHGQHPTAEAVRTSSQIGSNVLVVDRGMIKKDGDVFFDEMHQLASQGFTFAQQLKKFVFEPCRNSKQKYGDSVSVPLEIYCAEEQLKIDIFLDAVNVGNENFLSAQRVANLLNPESHASKIINHLVRSESYDAELFALGETLRCRQLAALKSFMQQNIKQGNTQFALAGFYERLIPGTQLPRVARIVDSSNAMTGGETLWMGLPPNFESIQQVETYLSRHKGQRAAAALDLVQKAYNTQYISEKMRAKLAQKSSNN